VKVVVQTTAPEGIRAGSPGIFAAVRLVNEEPLPENPVVAQTVAPHIVPGIFAFAAVKVPDTQLVFDVKVPLTHAVEPVIVPDTFTLPEPVIVAPEPTVTLLSVPSKVILPVPTVKIPVTLAFPSTNNAVVPIPIVTLPIPFVEPNVEIPVTCRFAVFKVSEFAS
jgi:hypothetical protein